jgi:hypothetical protein
MRPTQNADHFAFFLGNRLVLALAGLSFSIAAFQNSDQSEAVFRPFLVSYWLNVRLFLVFYTAQIYFQTKAGVPRDYNLHEGESSRIIFTEHSLALSARVRKYPEDIMELSAQDWKHL